MKYLKTFRIFEDEEEYYHPEDNMGSPEMIELANKLGDINNEAMYDLQSLLDRMTTHHSGYKGVNSNDLVLYISEYVQNSDLILEEDDFDGDADYMKNMKDPDVLKIASEINISDSYGMSELQFCLDELLSSGVEKSDVISYVKEYLS